MKPLLTSISNIRMPLSAIDVLADEEIRLSLLDRQEQSNKITAQIDKLTAELLDTKDKLYQANAKIFVLETLLKTKSDECDLHKQMVCNAEDKYCSMKADMEKRLETMFMEMNDLVRERDSECHAKQLAENLLAIETQSRIKAENQCALLMTDIKRPIEIPPQKQTSYLLRIAGRDGNGGITSMRLIPEEQ